MNISFLFLIHSLAAQGFLGGFNLGNSIIHSIENALLLASKKEHHPKSSRKRHKSSSKVTSSTSQVISTASSEMAPTIGSSIAHSSSSKTSSSISSTTSPSMGLTTSHSSSSSGSSKTSSNSSSSSSKTNFTSSTSISKPTSTSSPSSSKTTSTSSPSSSKTTSTSSPSSSKTTSSSTSISSTITSLPSVSSGSTSTSLTISFISSRISSLTSSSTSATATSSSSASIGPTSTSLSNSSIVSTTVSSSNVSIGSTTTSSTSLSISSTTNSTTSSLPTSLTYSNTQYCGSANNGLMCNPNGDFGPCCSKDGLCGGSDDFCLPTNGCQNGCSISIDPAPKSCGDGFCDVRSETCYSCPNDCGDCDLTYVDNCVGKGQISLTFDDGPTDNGPLLLDTANKLGVKLTHFVIGNKLANPQYQTYLKNFYAAGHAIASHTFTHPFMTHLTDDQLRAELIKTDDAIFNVIGVRPLFMRNPYSDTNTRTMALIQSMGYQSIFTSLDSQDTVYGGTSNQNLILQNVQTALNQTDVSPVNNSFVLTQHETMIDSINYLPQIVQVIQKRGYNMPLIHTCRGAAQLYRNDVCGDKICSGYLENCASCPQDCGKCP